MIVNRLRDGIDVPWLPVDLRRAGWRPIETAPIAKLDVAIRPKVSAFCAEPNWIEGLTTHGNIVPARYCADGKYTDRWTNARGNCTYRLVAWRPLRSQRP